MGWGPMAVGSMVPERTSLRQGVWPALLAVLLYLPVVGSPSIWDDHDLLMNNNRVIGMTVRTAFTTDFWGNIGNPNAPSILISHYRPLALLAYSVLFRLFGMDPVPLHIANATLHGLATFAFFGLLAGLRLDRRICWIAALLFAVHPLHVESVAWISGMSETLAAATTLAALAFYVYGERNLSLLFAA